MITYLPPARANQAFSLVELSIVLVILGLLVGGVLSGKSLIHAAELRASIEQIKQYQVATRAFRDKYFNLPGDLPDPNRTRLGLTTAGCGASCNPNGDGVIVGYAWTQIDGEPNYFWLDLATKGLIQGSFAAPIPGGNDNLSISGSNIANYLPASKLGADQYIYIWSGGMSFVGSGRFGSDGVNYISIGGLTQLNGFNTGGNFRANATMPAQDAYSIDMKMDDGKPQTGGVTAIYIGYIGGAYVSWAGNVVDPPPRPGTTAVAASSTTCMDNGGVVGTMNYTVSGNNKTCALTFKLY